RGELGKHGTMITCLALTADGGTAATGGSDGTIKVWDVAQKKERRTTAAHRGWVRGLSFDPSGKRLLSAADEEARLWDVGTGKRERALAHGRFVVSAAVFTPDGKGVVTGGYDGSARLWDAEADQAPGRFRGLGGLDGVLIHPGTHTLAVWGSRSI